jgi:hypothetical protein
VLDLGLHIRGRALRMAHNVGTEKETSFYGGDNYDAIEFNGSVRPGTALPFICCDRLQQLVDSFALPPGPAGFQLSRQLTSIRCAITCRHTTCNSSQAGCMSLRINSLGSAAREMRCSV